jgi:hypothetical protein
MSESKIPRIPRADSSSEQFKVTEAATGKSFVIREMTDEQLARHLQEANTAHKQATVQAMAMFGQATTIAKASAAMQFEIERRAKSIQIVRSIQ